MKAEVPDAATMKTKNVSRYADRYIRNEAQRAGTVLSVDQRTRITGQLREYMYSQGPGQPTGVKKYLKLLVKDAIAEDVVGAKQV